jgi:hypothetical protein
MKSEGNGLTQKSIPRMLYPREAFSVFIKHTSERCSDDFKYSTGFLCEVKIFLR